MRGLDPHVLANLRYTSWEEAPLVFPGLTLFFIPFAIIGPAIGQYVYFIANVAAGIAFYGEVVRASGLCSRYSIRNPDLQTVLVTLGGFLFVNSVFFTLCIRGGQVSLFVALLLVLAITGPKGPRRIVSFGLGAVVKYSTVPVMGLQLFLIRRRFRFCVTSFVLFAAVSLYPALLGHNPFDLYQSYIACMQRWIAPGAANHFANSGYTMLSSGLFKVAPSVVINVIVLGLFLAAGVYKRSRLSPRIELHEWLAIGCVTMTLEYHRTYDGVLVYPFLLLAVYCMYKDGRRGHAAALGAFSLFFALPGALVDRIALWFGGVVGKNPVVYLPAGQFPILSLLFLVLTLYALYLYAFLDSTVAIASRVENHEGETEALQPG